MELDNFKLFPAYGAAAYNLVHSVTFFPFRCFLFTYYVFNINPNFNNVNIKINIINICIYYFNFIL
ncbi:hypothetical protein CE91St56_20210 [Lachnospiraceae bacterium]|nr:hypothetical protein CE91St56_20210 [Lachnospiraceae bacterium]GKH40965.1 hypothetical protein CE91St57_19390 [Lachnospiraceae bacterium]